jgi:multidrug efflux pump subunit AcrA (membrane-fusion protein)
VKESKLLSLFVVAAVAFVLYVLLPAYWSPSSRVFASRLGSPSVMRMLGYPIEVEVAPVQMRRVTRVIAADGATSYLNEIPVHSEVPGIVTEMLVELGEKIESGQALLYVNPGGHTMRMFDLRRELRQREVEHAKAELERARKLYERDLISTAQYEIAKIALGRAETASELALEEYAHSLRSRSIAVTGEPPPWTGVAPAGQRVEIVATAAGTVIERTAQLGENLIDLRKPLLVIGDQLVFQANVDQRYADLVRTGDQGKIYLRARPGEAIPTKVVRVAPAVAATEAGPARQPRKSEQPPFTFAVWMAIPQTVLAEAKLLSGMTGYALFDKAYDASALPESALMRYSGRTGTVLVVDEANRLQVRTVTYTGAENGWVAIGADDLSEGSMVVVKGQTGLKAGDQVAVSQETGYALQSSR